MAAFRSKKAIKPIGSASWISDERDSAQQFLRQEEEEFEYAVINDFEWLNEHMSEIFSKTRKCITDFFKTPGKLRGKTPRTIQKRNAPEARAPLTDIFAPKSQASSSTPRAVNSTKQQKAFQVVIENVARRTLLPPENTRSPSDDGSSPVQPILRKSSVSFATLPTRALFGGIGDMADENAAENLPPAGHGHPEVDYTPNARRSLAAVPNLADGSSAKKTQPAEHGHPQVDYTPNTRKSLAAVVNYADGSSPKETQPVVHAHPEVDYTPNTRKSLAAVVNYADGSSAKKTQPAEHAHPELDYVSLAKQSLLAIGNAADESPAEDSEPEIPPHNEDDAGAPLIEMEDPPDEIPPENPQPAELPHSEARHEDDAGAPLIEMEDPPEDIPLESSQPAKQAHTEVNYPQLKTGPHTKVPPDDLGASKAKLSSIFELARGVFASSAEISAQAKMENTAPSTVMEKVDAKVQDSETYQSQSQPVTRSMKDIKRPTKPGQAAVSKAKPVPVAIKVGMSSQRELDHRKVNPVNPSNTTLSSTLQQSLAPTAASTKQTRAVTTNLRKVTTNTTLKNSVASSQPAKPRALAAAARKKEQDERDAQRRLEAKREIERKRLAQQEEDKKKKRLENTKKQEPQKNGTMQTRTRNGNNLAAAMQQEKAQTNMGPPASRGELSNARAVSKMHTATNVAGPSEELVRIQPQINPARPPKRGVQVESTDEKSYGPPSKVTSTYVQADSKRRKTHGHGEDDVQIDMESGQDMPPPMRPSAIRKDTQENKSIATKQSLNIHTPVHQGTMHSASLFNKPTPLAQYDPQTNKAGTGNSYAPHSENYSNHGHSHVPHPESYSSQGHSHVHHPENFSHHGHGHSHVRHPGNYDVVYYKNVLNPASAIRPNPLLAPHDFLCANRAGTGHSHPNHPDMAKFANTKIPFADNQGNNAGAQRTAQHHPAFDSPDHINPSDIELPDIPTDSEDEEDDEDDYYKDMRKQLNLPGMKKKNSFVVPDWAKSPALREVLMAQQLMDPEKVFGPIPPINLEEVFKNVGSKQLARYRQRTSSANWSGPDRLTEEEIRKDFEARKKLFEQGEWSRDIGI